MFGRGYGIPGFCLLFMALCSCASTEITVNFRIDAADLDVPSMPVDVMILHDDNSEEKNLLVDLKEFEKRFEWFTEGSASFKRLREDLDRMNKWKRVKIDKDTKNLSPVKLHVGKERAKSTLLAVMLIKESKTPLAVINVRGVDAFELTVGKDSLSLQRKEP